MNPDHLKWAITFMKKIIQIVETDTPDMLDTCQQALVEAAYAMGTCSNRMRQAEADLAARDGDSLYDDWDDEYES